MKKNIIFLAVVLGVAVGTYAQDRQVTLPERPNRSKYTDYSTKDDGFWCAIQLGANYGDTGFVAQLDAIAGYRFSEFLKVGVGVSPRIGLKSVPVYFDARGNIIPQIDRMYSFYWNFDLGYAIKDGIYLSPGLGIMFGGIRHNFLIGLNYTLQGFENVQPKHFGGVRIGYEF